MTFTMSIKAGAETVERHEKTDVKTPNTIDGDEDMEEPEIRGVAPDQISPRYWLSFGSLGSATSIILLAICLSPSPKHIL